ncbi:MAG: flagellar basal-body rod protein FlgG [Eubacterium sp.]|nr:flagellar basal-body rod protein FlgG [Eubacterium sp.]
MMRSLWSAASGMIAQQTNVDTISNNIANVNTTGYKAEKAEFKSLLYQTLQSTSTSANGDTKPIPAQVGLGTRTASITSEFTQGALTDTGSDTDFAIDGLGFFKVANANGDEYYTRDGSFTLVEGADGLSLCTSDGLYVLDTEDNPIVFPEGVSSSQVYVSSAGSFAYYDSDGEIIDLDMSIGLYQFNNPSGLDKLGDNLYQPTDASGDPLSESENDNLVKSSLKQGYLEASNVSVADEMVNLIVAQRAYELNSKAITTSDEMLQQANQLKS